MKIYNKTCRKFYSEQHHIKKYTINVYIHLIKLICIQNRIKKSKREKHESKPIQPNYSKFSNVPPPTKMHFSPRLMMALVAFLSSTGRPFNSIKASLIRASSASRELTFTS